MPYRIEKMSSADLLHVLFAILFTIGSMIVHMSHMKKEKDPLEEECNVEATQEEEGEDTEEENTYDYMDP